MAESESVPHHIAAAQDELFAIKPVKTIQSTNFSARRILKRRKTAGQQLDERLQNVVANKKNMDEFLGNLVNVLKGTATEIPDLTVRWRKEFKELKKCTKKTSTATEKHLKNMATALNSVAETVNVIKKMRERDLMEIETLKGQLSSFISSSAEEIQKIQQSELARPPSAVGAMAAEGFGEKPDTGLLNTTMFRFIDYKVMPEAVKSGKRGKGRKK